MQKKKKKINIFLHYGNIVLLFGHYWQVDFYHPFPPIRGCLIPFILSIRGVMISITLPQFFVPHSLHK